MVIRKRHSDERKLPLRTVLDADPVASVLPMETAVGIERTTVNMQAQRWLLRGQIAATMRIVGAGEGSVIADA